MINYKTTEEIDLIKEGADILGRAHGEVARCVKEGVTTRELDKIANEFIHDHNGKPSFLNYNGFPASLCISVNEAVVHGIPGDYMLKSGDIVSIDCGVYYKGFHSDSAYTYGLGEVDEDLKNLLRITEQSLYKGIDEAVYGKRIGDVSYAIQSFIDGFGYGIVRELVGHGLGRKLHENPEVPNYGKRGKGVKLKEGLVIAIEPMINLGTRRVVQENDGWTVRTADRKQSAHFEHTIAVFKERTEVLTTHKYIEQNYKLL